MPLKEELGGLALYRMRVHWVNAIHKLGSELSPDPGFPDTLILDFLDSRTLRNECLLFKPKNKQKLQKLGLSFNSIIQDRLK